MTHRFLLKSHPSKFKFIVLICMMSLMVAALCTSKPAAANTEQPDNTADSSATIGSIPLVDENDPAFSKTYAYVLQPAAAADASAPDAAATTAGVPVFASPEDALNNAAPVKFLTPGYDWVTVRASAELSATQFSQIKEGEWVYANTLTTGRASAFQGRVFDKNPARPFAWVIKAFQPSLEPGGAANADAPSYQRYDLVYIYGKALAGKLMWYRVGENEWAPQSRVSVVSPRRAPRAMTARQRLHSKWISVNIFEQNVAAYEGDRLVFVSLVSSGLPKWETVRGTFQIWSKNVNQAMFNEESGDGRGHYYLEDVPYTMYFHQDYALHGAYWHDGFGYKHSHGCVNLSPKDAKWLFSWSTPTASQWGYGQASAEDPGTWVSVY